MELATADWTARKEDITGSAIDSCNLEGDTASQFITCPCIRICRDKLTKLNMLQLYNIIITN